MSINATNAVAPAPQRISTPPGLSPKDAATHRVLRSMIESTQAAHPEFCGKRSGEEPRESLPLSPRTIRERGLIEHRFPVHCIRPKEEVILPTAREREVLGVMEKQYVHYHRTGPYCMGHFELNSEGGAVLGQGMQGMGSSEGIAALFRQLLGSVS